MDSVKVVLTTALGSMHYRQPMASEIKKTLPVTINGEGLQ